MKTNDLTGQKDTRLSFFIFTAIKLKTKACDKSLSSFYWDHIDITSTVQIEQENKSWPGNFFARDNAQRLYLAWTTWRLQKCLYRNHWSHGEICTACFDLLFCLILSRCPQPRLCTESGQFHLRFTLHTQCPSFFCAKVIPDEFFIQGLVQLPFEFPWRSGLNHMPWSLVFQKHSKNSAAF